MSDLRTFTYPSKEYPKIAPTSSPGQDPPNLEDYRAAIMGLPCECLCPGHADRQFGDEIYLEFYEHDGGWQVLGFTQRQWLGVRCSQCAWSGTSIWKIGIPGDVNHTQYATSILLRRVARLEQYKHYHPCQDSHWE